MPKASPQTSGDSPLSSYQEQEAVRLPTNWVRGGIAAGMVAFLVSLAAEGASALAYSSSGEPMPREVVEALFSQGATVSLLAVALWLSLTKLTTRAAILTIVAISLHFGFSLFQRGFYQNMNLPGIPVLVAGAGLLLGTRVTLWLGCTAAFATPALVLSGRAFRGEAPLLHPGDLPDFLSVAVVLLAMAFLISLVLKDFGRVLTDARRNQMRFADLVAGNPDGFISLDRAGRIQEYNPAAEVLLGIPASVAMGTELRALPLLEGTCVPVSVPIPDEAAVSSTPPTIPTEERLVRPDGTERWVEALTKPLRLSGGEAGTIVVLRDVTKRREAQARAIQLGQIVEEAQNEIYVFHRDTLEILTANRGARENLGYSKEEIRGMAMFQVQPTLTPEAGRLLSKKLFEEGEEVVTLNTVHHRKDGSVYPLEVQFQRGLQEGTPSILAFVVDISEKEKAAEEQRLLEAQLQHAQKMEAVGLLAGGVAHDFNNLLTVIGGCGEILLDIGSKEVQDLTKEILEAQERGAALTQQLLAFARREIVTIEDLSLPEVIEGMEALIRRALSEQVRLELEMKGRGHVRADRGQLEQIVLNLASNARDAMPQGGSLTIRVDRAGPNGNPDPNGAFVSLSMVDTGKGMDAPTMNRVFEPFYTTKPRGKGTGLGLSTVHGIVSQNGGRILVDSEPGVGTNIRVLWPGTETDLSAISQGGGETGDPVEKGTILVAEDEEAARSVIRAVLEKEGYRMVDVEDGTEALKLLKDPGFEVDLLLTDIVMPGLSGIELADRARVFRPGIPILFMSGYVDAHLSNPDEPSGPLNLLAKPFRASELRDRVRELLPASVHQGVSS